MRYRTRYRWRTRKNGKSVAIVDWSMSVSKEEIDRLAWEQIWYIDKGHYANADPAAVQKLGHLIRNGILKLPVPPPIDSPVEVPETGSVLNPVPPPDPVLAELAELAETCKKRRLSCPFAEQAQAGIVRGTYPGGFPQGAVIHWTAGHRNGLKTGRSFMTKSRYLYFLIDANGGILQPRPINEWGYHCGKSYWRGRSSLHRYFVGIECQAAGKLKKIDGDFYPWWDRGGSNYTGPYRKRPANRIPADQVAYSPHRENISGGYYHKLTISQFNAVRKLVLWLHYNNTDSFDLGNVVGHDEISPGRKVDMGGALVDDQERVLTGNEFRLRLATDAKKLGF